ncbi:MAG: hypothetical protein ACI4JY_11045 [Oscillospiraceae bacterium]
MQFKHKFIQRITAAVTAITVSVSALSITTLAWTGESSGGSVAANYGDYPYGFSPSRSASWRVDLYVSANNDGRIKPETDSIASAALPWVGAVLLTPTTKDTFIQCDYTAERKPLTAAYKVTKYENGYPVGEEYNLPHCYEMKPDTKFMDDPVSGKRVFVVKDTYGLPTEHDAVTEANYESKVKNIIESNDFTYKVIDEITKDMGGSKAFLQNVIPKIKGAPLAKLSEKYQEYMAGNCASEEVMNLIRPDKEECIVEWACVVTSMTSYREGHSGCVDGSSHDGYDCSFWEMNLKTSSGFEPAIRGNDTFGKWFVLDSWWSAQYNQTTKTLYTDSSYLATLDSMHLYVRKGGEMIYNSGVHKHGGSLELYKTNGKLHVEIYRLVANVAMLTHDTHDGTIYCGVYTSKGFSATDFANTSRMNEEKMAKYGGISVYKNTIPDPGIPVFYYEYDPNTNQPTGNVFTDTFQPNGDTTAKFQPSEAHGIPIAAESHKVNDKKRALLCEYPLVYFLARESTEPTAKKAAKVTILTHTMLAPHGVFAV